MSERWPSLALLLLLAAALAYVAQDFVDRAIVTPLLYFYWLGRLLWAAIPQAVVWGLFLLVAAVITGRSLWQRRTRPQRMQLLATPPSGRIDTWLRLIERADQELYYRWQLAQQLRQLTLGALAHDQRLSRREVRQKLRENDLGLPPEVQAYFQASATSLGHLGRPRWPWLRAKAQATPLDLKPEKIAQFLEEKFNL